MAWRGNASAVCSSGAVSQCHHPPTPTAFGGPRQCCSELFGKLPPLGSKMKGQTAGDVPHTFRQYVPVIPEMV